VYCVSSWRPAGAYFGQIKGMLQLKKEKCKKNYFLDLFHIQIILSVKLFLIYYMLYIFCFLLLVGIVYGDCDVSAATADPQIKECSHCTSIPCDFEAKIYKDYGIVSSMSSVTCNFYTDSANTSPMEVDMNLKITYVIQSPVTPGQYYIECTLDGTMLPIISVTLGIYENNIL